MIHKRFRIIRGSIKQETKQIAHQYSSQLPTKSLGESENICFNLQNRKLLCNRPVDMTYQEASFTNKSLVLKRFVSAYYYYYDPF